MPDNIALKNLMDIIYCRLLSVQSSTGISKSPRSIEQCLSVERFGMAVVAIF